MSRLFILFVDFVDNPPVQAGLHVLSNIIERTELNWTLMSSLRTVSSYSPPHSSNHQTFSYCQCAGGLGKGVGRVQPPPQFMSTDANFWVKIGFEFQSLCKNSKISTSDPPVLLGQFQHWLLHRDRLCACQSCRCYQLDGSLGHSTLKVIGGDN